MARRGRSSFIEDLIDLVSKLPWWAGLLLAAIFYLWLRHVASQPIPASPTDLKQLGDSVTSQVWHTLASMLQYVIPLACLIGAAVSAFQKFGRKRGGGSYGSMPDISDAPMPQHRSSTNQPLCPACGAGMVKRTAKKGNNAGQAFWGCSKYPACKGTRAS
jgi:hypothetical protein